MKINGSARWIVRIRGIVIALALFGMVGSAFWLGESVAARFGQTTARQTEPAQFRNFGVGDLVAAAR